GLDSRKSYRRPEIGAETLAAEDLGGNSGRSGCGLSVRSSFYCHTPRACPGSHGVWINPLRDRARRRLARILGQAPIRVQGQRWSHSGARRRAGPDRLDVDSRDRYGGCRVRLRRRSDVWSPSMTPIAAARPQGDAPDLAPVLGRRITVLGSTGSIGISTLDV